MVSFRFFLVSIIAVFLALAVGITMGATVIDKATVDLLRSQIRTQKARATNAEKHSADLNDLLKRANDFESSAAATLVDGTLVGIPVLVVGVRGAEQNVNDITKILLEAGATVEGTVWFTKNMRLDKSDSTVTNLASAFGISGSQLPDDVRRGALVKLALAWTTAASRSDVTSTVTTTPQKTLLGTMKDMGLVDFDSGEVKDVNLVPAPRTRFVIVSNAQPDAPNETVAIPFVAELAKNLPARTVAVDSGTDGNRESNKPEVREVFVGPLRADVSVKGKLSTVDNGEDIRGRIALVFAIRDLPTQIGHFGVGGHASDGLIAHS